MTSKEATARIKINKLLEVAGWRFFAEGKSPANIQLEPSITIKTFFNRPSKMLVMHMQPKISA